MGTESQTIVFVERRSRRMGWPWLLVLSLLVAWVVWHLGVRFWDDYTSYSGVIVGKGEDFSLLDIFFGNSSGPDLYITLQDEKGKRSKRYVGSFDSSVNEWSQLQVGSFVVKKKGFGEFPCEPGKAIQSVAAPPLPNTDFSSRDLMFIGLLASLTLALAWLVWRFG